jgi:hypothetical protein
MPKSILVLAVLAPAAFMLVTGCGGGDATITKAELIKQGDAICEKADNMQYEESIAYEKNHAKSFSGLSGAAIQEKLMVAVGLPSFLTEAKELEALGSPKGDEEKVKAIIVGIEEAVKKADKDPKSVEASSSPFNEPDNLAREYGFKACASVI